MKITQSTAQSQYYSRPDDQRYRTIDDLRAAADAEKASAATARLYTRDLKIEPTSDPTNPIAIFGPSGTRANLTPWSFGQLCSFLQAPRDYLRRQAPELIAQCLTADQQRAAADPDNFRDEHRLLMHLNGADTRPTCRAITSPKYARLWDSDLLRITDDWRASNPALSLPPVWNGDQGKTGGAYRSDRDMFLIMTDGGSIVTDPTAGSSGGSLYRGVIIQNSEVGAATCNITGFWFRTICGNHMIQGFEQTIDFNRRHVGRSFHAEVAQALRRINAWLARPASDDRRLIDAALKQTIGDTEKDAIENLTRSLKLPASTAEEAIRRAAATEECNPLSVWGAVQGITRISQERPHFADRMALDVLASRLLSRVKVAVAA